MLLIILLNNTEYIYILAIYFFIYRFHFSFNCKSLNLEKMKVFIFKMNLDFRIKKISFKITYNVLYINEVIRKYFFKEM